MSQHRLLLGLLTLALAGAATQFVELNADPAPQTPLLGGTTAFRLRSPFDGQIVAPFTEISWKVQLKVSPDDNQGLALFGFDFVQDRGNASLFSIPAALAPVTELTSFDRPGGFTNPALKVGFSGFGGIPIGPFRERNRAQIGGAQNTFGKVGPCFGQTTVVCMGQDVDVDTGIGQQSSGLLAARGAFRAPLTPGTYTFRIENMIANTLDVVRVAPNPSTTNAASIRVLNDSFTFTVQ